MPQVEDEAKQKWHYEQAERMPLANFTSGLGGQAGKFTRFSLPENMDQEGERDKDIPTTWRHAGWLKYEGVSIIIRTVSYLEKQG